MNRRKWIKLAALTLGWCTRFLIGGVAPIYAAMKRKVLGPDIDPLDLADEHPARIDARNLKVSELDSFETMGTTTFDVDRSSWRLEVAGDVSRPLELSYREILAMPALEKKVLLICPGVFSYMALWKGVSLMAVLQKAGVSPTADRIEISGPQKRFRKKETFKIEEVESGKIFLAHGVNGHELPEKHGFPLRVVAEDRFGDDWVKCVFSIRAFDSRTG